MFFYFFFLSVDVVTWIIIISSFFSSFIWLRLPELIKTKKESCFRFITIKILSARLNITNIIIVNVFLQGLMSFQVIETLAWVWQI